jgi:parallel beta-helix repeat protein
MGIFFCWGVTHGLAENCVLSDNDRFGISIGHRDTDNIITGCKINGNGQVGILFREPNGDNTFNAGNRNTIENCDIYDNGSDQSGIGIDIGWLTEDITVKKNRIGNTGSQKQQQTGIRISENANRITLSENTFKDSPVEVEDLR